jgi:hypothetical protein
LPKQLAAAWPLVYQRLATGEELEQAVAFVTAQVEMHKAAQPVPAAAPSEENASRRNRRRDETARPAAPAESAEERAELLALTDFCQALLSSNEFLYID